ncbi:hypothetical protein ACYOEI_13745 [Singulisphaera rosea]
MRRLLPVVAMTGVIAYFAGGFVSGVVSCPDANQDFVANTLKRRLVGGVYCVMSAMTLGFPPTDFAEGTRQNAWPYIIECWLVLMLMVIGGAALRKKPERS